MISILPTVLKFKTPAVAVQRSSPSPASYSSLLRWEFLFFLMFFPFSSIQNYDKREKYILILSSSSPPFPSSTIILFWSLQVFTLLPVYRPNCFRLSCKLDTTGYRIYTFYSLGFLGWKFSWACCCKALKKKKMFYGIGIITFIYGAWPLF